jgi:hypothetical protein
MTVMSTRKDFVLSFGVIFNLIAALCLARAETRPGVVVEDPAFRFEIIGMHEPVEHTFYFENTGQEVLQLTNVTVTAPLQFIKASARVAPGDKGRVIIRLGEPREKGDFEGEVEVAFKNPGVSNLVFQVSGRITPSIECSPMAAFFVATQRGQPKEASIQIINHEKEPLEILAVEHASTRFSTELQTVQPGQRYTLTLALKADGNAGRVTELITLVTSSKKQPTVKIQANTLIRERVYTFPDGLDFGLIRIQELKDQPQLTEFLTQIVMVYQTGGTDFTMTARTDLPFLKLSPEASKLKDRYEIKVEVIPDKLKPGRIDSSIAIETNDPEFARLEIPVRTVVE